MSKGKPILFSTPMVKAILDGRKTMTRRVIKPQPTIMANGKPLNGYNDSMIKAAGEFPTPKYQPGDILWVRETWGIGTRPDPMQGWVDGVEFKADEAFIDEIESLPLYHTDNEALFELYSNDERKGWHPSIFMPREASRLFLRVTDVRVERVQDILCGDMQREGCIPKTVTGGQWQQWQHDYWIPLWDSIYVKRGYGWDKNPWVWVYSFERVDKPSGWPGGEGGE